MEKKKIEVHAVTIHIYTIIIAVLVVIVAFVSLKYLHLKFAVEGFTRGAIMLNNQQVPSGSISDYGEIIATTVANYPQGNPMWSQPAVLQNYVTTLSKQLNRDIVVVDKTRKILADTIPANIGQNYTSDPNHEVDLTMQDSQARPFVEKSKDYPQGLLEEIVPVKDAAGQVVGIVLVSNVTLSQ